MSLSLLCHQEMFQGSRNIFDWWFLADDLWAPEEVRVAAMLSRQISREVV